MLRVQDYLRSGRTIEHLAAEFGIAAYRHPRLPLVGLKYLSHAPRFDLLVGECRGLVLEDGSWEVVAKPFDRFYNAAEAPEAFAAFNWSRCSCQSKEDGSLAIVYPYRRAWHVNSSGGFGHHRASFVRMSWAQLFWETSGLDVARLDDRFTYVFELCSPYTKVVRPYPQATAFLLSMFEIASCRESPIEVVDEEAARLSVRRPELYGAGGAGPLGARPDVEDVEPERFEGLDQGLARVLDLAVGRLADVVGCGDIGDDLGLDPDLLQPRRLVLGGPLAHGPGPGGPSPG